MTEDQQLLQDYVRYATPQALDELVRRYRDLVYSSALRQVRDPHLAEDVAQAVFIVLSKKASTIRHGVALGGWLLAVTRRAALNAMKKQAIQHRHERAAARSEVIETAEASWEQIDPVLDSIISRLSNKDRDAVVLRYFQDRSFAQVGAELGLSEDAARKRVGRALERMRHLLRGQGVFIGAAALGTTIASHSVHAAPSTIAGVSTSMNATTIAKGVIAMTKIAQLKALVAAAAIFLLIGGGAAVVMTAMAQQPDAVTQDHSAAPTTAPFDADAARQGIVVRLQALRNLSATYHMEISPTDAPGRSSDRTFSRLDDRIRSELKEPRLLNSQDITPGTIQRTVVRAGDTRETLTAETRQGVTSQRGSIDENPPVSADMVEWILKLGSPSAELSVADVLTMDISRSADGNVVLRQADNKKAREWEFRPDMGYALVAFRAFTPPDSKPNSEALSEDFKPVQGVLLPHTFKIRFSTKRNGQLVETERQTATIGEYQLNDAQNTEGRFHIKWPAGTHVMDMRTSKEFIAGEDGKLISSKP